MPTELTDTKRERVQVLAQAWIEAEEADRALQRARGALHEAQNKAHTSGALGQNKSLVVKVGDEYVTITRGGPGPRDYEFLRASGLVA